MKYDPLMLKAVPEPVVAVNAFPVLAPGRSAADELLAFADRHRWWLFAGVVACYLAAFNGQWRIQPDAALYLSIGRNLAEGRGYTYLGQRNHLVYPGWPALIAVTFKLFGTRSLVPVHAVMLAVAAGTLAATYRLFLLHAGRPTAVAVTFGVALTKTFFVYAFELWSDLPFTLGVMALLAGYEGVFRGRGDGVCPRGRWVDWALLLGGCGTALLMRPTGWPLLAATTLALLYQAARGRMRWATLVGVGVALVGLAVAYVAMDPRRGLHAPFGGVYEQYVIQRVTGGALTARDHTLLRNVADLFAWAASDVMFQVRMGTALNALLGGVVLLLGFALFRHRSLWGLWFVLLLATILISQETLDRYFLPVLPLLVFAWWDALVRLDRALARRWPARRRWADGLFLALLGFGAIANVTKVGGIVIQQRARPFLATYDRGRYEVVPAFAGRVGNRVPADGLVLLKVKPPYGRVLAFLSRRDVKNAGETTAAELRGRSLFVVEPADDATRALVRAAGLAEGPPLFTVTPSTSHGDFAVPLSLHGTYVAPVNQ